eukprot:CAMPEP_0177649512 /NCGR_PEP_ID=MMETSP0447-20121125/11435_1 /TAXON_ID=0 /ORGANISM="Stygamoeba regulata, Strain BSH-02190019" /LENGTH=124 /DNA_ID=CAMNT_0019152293 /DNA_START=184 /DNA_END=558 /DNA_ORIENTATION=+
MDRTLLSCLCALALLFALANANCNNDNDLGVFAKDNTTFMDTMRGCALKSLGNADKTASCLQKATGVSADCATCFGATCTCTRDHCLTKCTFSPTGKACSECVVKHCQPDLVKCAGVPADQLPQ